MLIRLCFAVLRVKLYLFCCERSVLILSFEFIPAGLLLVCLIKWLCLCSNSHFSTSEIQAIDQLFSLVCSFFGLLLLLFTLFLLFVEFHCFYGSSFGSVIIASMQEFFVFGQYIVGCRIVVCLESRSTGFTKTQILATLLIGLDS